MLQINTKQLKSRKQVEIDGHPYTVRRIGAGEELTLSQGMRLLEKLAKKEKDSELSESEYAEIDQMTVDTIELMAGCFDDGGDGSKSRQLVRSLSEAELTLMMQQIFKDEGSDATKDPRANTTAVS